MFNRFANVLPISRLKELVGTSAMKRLSVRLSIVGAVLALGGATITHQLLSRGGPEPPVDDSVVAQEVANAEQTGAPTPIRGDDGPPADKPVSPPTSTAFRTDSTLRPVTRKDDPEYAFQPTEPARFPTPSPADSSGVEAAAGYSEYEPAEPPPAYGGSAYGGPADAVADATTSDPPIEPTTDASNEVAAQPPSSIPDPPGYVVPSSKSRPTTSGAWDPPSSSSTTGAGASAASANPLVLPISSRRELASDTSSFPAAPPAASGFPTGASDESASGGIPDAPTTTATNDASTEPVENTSPVDTSPIDKAPAVTSQTVTSQTDNAASPATLRPGAEMTNASNPAPHAPDAGSSYTSPYAAPPMSAGPARNAGNSLDANRFGSSPAAATGSAALVHPPASVPPTDSPAYGSSAGQGTAAITGAALSADLSSNVPGDRSLEGQQSPSVVIGKSAPEEIQVDRPATFQIRVRNVGNATAHNVTVVDQVPRGTEFVDAVPACTQASAGILIWSLPTLGVNEEVVLSMNLIPKVAGEVGSVAQATFQAQASVRTICTQPKLTVELKVPEQVLVGAEATCEIVVTNTGSGAATNVLVEEEVPEGFTHAAGKQLELAVGTLKPQESRRLSLALKAVTAGTYENHLTVRADGDLFEEVLRSIEVTSPQLELALDGPTLRYLDRQATYLLRVSNPGSAPARNVELVTHLPKGMKYVTSDNHGQYDSQAHAVYWTLEELPAAQQGEVHVSVLPIEPGNHKLKADGRADLGLQHVCEHEVVVEGLAELAFAVTDAADPIEVGSDTTYEVRVHNRGSKSDSDVRVIAELPPGMTPTAGDGPATATVQGRQVIFSPLTRLAPNEEAIYKIHAKGEATGDHVIRVQLQSAELRVPVTKEEMTRVYSDR